MKAFAKRAVHQAPRQEGSSPGPVINYLPQEPAQPTRAAPSKPHKFVARGATERAPVMLLPPSPGEDDDDDSDSELTTFSQILTARQSPMQKPTLHLIPRGPTEREPMLQLPPSPSDDEDDYKKSQARFRSASAVSQQSLARPGFYKSPSMTASQSALRRQHRIRRVDSTFGLNEQY